MRYSHWAFPKSVWCATARLGLALNLFLFCPSPLFVHPCFLFLFPGTFFDEIQQNYWTTHEIYFDTNYAEIFFYGRIPNYIHTFPLLLLPFLLTFANHNGANGHAVKLGLGVDAGIEGHAVLGALKVEGRHWWMVRHLFGRVIQVHVVGRIVVHGDTPTTVEGFSDDGVIRLLREAALKRGKRKLQAFVCSFLGKKRINRGRTAWLNDCFCMYPKRDAKKAFFCDTSK